MPKLKREKFNVKVKGKKYTVIINKIHKTHPRGVYSVNLRVNNTLYLKGALIIAKNKEVLKERMKSKAISRIKKYH